MSPRQSADAIRADIRSVVENARREREYEARREALAASEARCAALMAEVDAKFTSTPMPRRALSDALHAVERAAGGGFVSANDQDGREASLLMAVDRLVAVCRAVCDGSSEVNLDDVLFEADRAERTAQRARREAAQAREAVENRLRAVLRTLEEGR